MDQLDRYVLGLAVLEGDRDARKILADLLEEQGDRGLAQWARTCKGRSVRRLDLAIMLLPCRTALRLGSDFAAKTEFFVGGNTLRLVDDVSKVVARWLDGEIPDSNFDRLIQYAKNQGMNVGYVRRQLELSRLNLDAFHEATALCDELAALVKFVMEGNTADEARLIKHRDAMTNQRVRQIARLSQRSSTDLPRQIAHTIAAFNHLIAPEKLPWPK